MKIAIMMRAMDQDSGFRAYTESLIDTMLQIDRENSYLLLYRTPKWFGRFSSSKNAKEVLLSAPHKLLWDQVAVPFRAWKERADVIFNPKFTVPLICHCPVTMGLAEPVWWAWPEHYERWDVRYMRAMLPLYCWKAAYFFPRSNFILEENRKHLGLPFVNAVVAYYAPEEPFQPIDSAAILDQFRNKYQLPPRFILSVTRVDHPGLEKSTSFHAGKNVDTTLRAFAFLRKEIPHKLVIAGRRVHEYLLHKGFSNSDLEDVHLLGFVPHEELAQLYNLAELFVMPSFYEGFGLSLLEAMACGCPAVASQTGACPEVSGGATLLANPHDPADFAAKILSVIHDKDLRQELRTKGLQRAAWFSWEQTARHTLEGLKRAVNGSRRASRS